MKRREEGQRPPKKEWVNNREFRFYYEREEVRKWRKG
jgi:hypothetical protein